MESAARSGRSADAVRPALNALTRADPSTARVAPAEPVANRKVQKWSMKTRVQKSCH
jgi:hypothetical protein